MVTIQEVAKRAKVSTMTVNRALNSPEKLKKETLEKVKKAIEELGYYPNYTAAALRQSRSNSIGLTLFDIENPFMSRLVMQLENKLKDKNYSTLVFFANEESTDDFEIYRKAKNFNVDFQFFIPTKYNKFMDELSIDEKRKCCQIFKNVYPEIDSFIFDDIYGTYLATKKLIESGHEKILLIDYNQRTPLYRKKGYEEALREFGLEFNQNYLLEVEEFTDCLKETIVNKIKELMPTAIITITQKLCVKCIEAFRELNLKIYKDISLISYDDSVLMEYLNITTVSHPFEEMIDSLYKWTIERLSGKDKEPNHTIVKPFLNERSSVRRLK